MTWTTDLVRRLTDRSVTPVPYVSRSASTGGAFGRLFGSGDGRENEMKMYGAVGTLFSVVSLISNTQAQIEWKLYRKAKSGKKEDRTEITSHAALDLWDNPNPFYTQHMFIETFQQHLELVGETDWVVVRSGSMPTGLWPVRPDRIEPVPDPTDFLSGYWYHGPDGAKVWLDSEDVIQIKLPNPLDPYRGMGPVQSLLADLDSIRYSADWNRNFFINGAEPGGIIEVPNGLSDPDFERISRRWAEQHRGVGNAHRVAIIEQGKWVDRQFNQRDMQFAELRTMGRDVVREAYRVHPHKLGQSTDVNLANAQAADYTYANDIDRPRADRIKDILNHRFLIMFGSTAGAGIEFDFEDPAPENQELENATLVAKATAAKLLIEAGLDRTGVLEACDLPDIAVAATPPVIEIPQKVPETVPGQPAPKPDALALPTGRLSIVDDHGHLYMQATPPDGTPATLPAAGLPDVSGAKEALDSTLAALLIRWRELSAEWKAYLVAQIRHYAENGQLSDLASLTLDSAAGAAALALAMNRLATIAGRQVVAEARAQGVTLAAAVPTAQALQDVADLTAALLADELKVSAARAALAAHGTSVSADDVAQHAQVALDALTMASPTKQLGGALHGTINATRIETLRRGPVGAMYAQEMNDSHTCRPCRTVNGTWLANTDDLAPLELSYPNGAYGGYINCEGGVNCRGTVVGVWREGSNAD